MSNGPKHGLIIVRSLVRRLQQFADLCKRVANICSFSTVVSHCLSDLCILVHRVLVLLKQTIITTYKQCLMSGVSGLGGLLHLVYHLCVLGVCVTQRHKHVVPGKVNRGQIMLGLTFPYWWDKASNLRAYVCSLIPVCQVLTHLDI